MPFTIASIISLILTETPDVVGLLNKLQAAGRTEASADELAELGVDDAALQAAHDRLFPPPTAPATPPTA